MAVDYEAVKHLINDYARDVCSSFSVDKVVLYGSYAKGSADEQSDIDVCFFMHSFGELRRVDVIGELLRLMRNHKGVYFEPIAFPTSELYNDNPFVNEILRTGIEVSFGT